MKQQKCRVVTTEDLEVENFISRQYNLRLECIQVLIKKCGLGINDVSICVNLAPTTIYRYLNHKWHMKIEKFFQIVVYLTKYMQEHNIPIDEELEKLDQLTSFVTTQVYFPQDLKSNLKSFACSNVSDNFI